MKRCSVELWQDNEAGIPELKEVIKVSCYEEALIAKQLNNDYSIVIKDNNGCILLDNL